MATAFFVDLPNFYSRLVKSKISDPKTLRNFFLGWLDFDLIAQDLCRSDNESLSIWMFYSGSRLGPSSERIESKHLTDYIDRINRLKGVTAYDVNIPGEQREAFEFTCTHCGAVNSAESKGEKGIDASLTVHLFDTMDSWDTAYLLSGDADYVPVVASLRRRGKVVHGAGFPDASPALIRECFSYTDLSPVLRQIFLAYTILKNDGVATKWFQSFPSDSLGNQKCSGIACYHDQISFWLRRNINEQKFMEFFEDLTKDHDQRKVQLFNETNYKNFYLPFSVSAFETVKRRAAQLSNYLDISVEQSDNPEISIHSKS